MTSILDQPRSLIGLPKDEWERRGKKAPEKERQALLLWYEETETTPWRLTPASMSVHLEADRWRTWRYWMLLGQKFRDAVTGVSPRQLWAMPPRYGKSAMASQWGPTWALDRNPATKIILASYGDDLAEENARATLDLLKDHSTHLRAQLRPDVKRRDRFMTPQGGGILAAGLRSGITGFGAHGIVVDDPFKNWQEAHS